MPTLSRLLPILLASVLLAGCTALMLGGQGNGASPGAAGGTADDVATAAAVRRRFADDTLLAQYALHVETRAGRTTLSGTVDSYSARQRAADVAAGVAGVVAVDNRIEVRHD